MKAEVIRSLLEKAEEARKKSYSPYSRYPVGAALMAKDGTIYAGCNVENVSYGALSARNGMPWEAPWLMDSGTLPPSPSSGAMRTTPCPAASAARCCLNFMCPSSSAESHLKTIAPIPWKNCFLLPSGLKN